MISTESWRRQKFKAEFKVSLSINLVIRTAHEHLGTVACRKMDLNTAIQGVPFHSMYNYK